VRGGHTAHAPGSFDFLAAYVVHEDAWYIIPVKLTGQKLHNIIPESQTATYEDYREAWHLLREASEGSGEGEAAEGESSAEDSARAETGGGDRHPAEALGRMEAAMNFLEQRLERDVDPQKR
jgi:hypothetical protein